MHPIHIKTITGTTRINGKYRRDLEKPNWHYYEDEDGWIYHFRKEHVSFVAELKNGADTK